MNIVISILSVAAALLAAGFIYQLIGAHRDRRRFIGSGRLVSIGPRCKLYLLKKGSGGPTVLFESGIAATNLNWFRVQEAVSRFTGTASYDRCGLGWSSPCRTSAHPATSPSNCTTCWRALRSSRLTFWSGIHSAAW